MGVQMDEFKARQRTTWEAGDYDPFSERIGEVGELVVARAQIEPGTSVLDVACGTGNASLRAARVGAQVTGLDLAPKLLSEGRAKAQAAGLEIDWVEGDAEALPFEDGRFERVLSTFGHMFAPRHRRTAEEMVRVCRDGGTIVTAAWTPEGTVGELMRAGGAYMPPPPDYASPPSLWGTEEHVRELFGPVAKELEFERRAVWVEADSLEAWAEDFMGRFPTMVAAQAALGERFPEFRDKVVAIWEEANESTDGSFRMPQEYLLSAVWL
jgi:SAM-dependent methyltransferase